MIRGLRLSLLFLLILSGTAQAQQTQAQQTSMDDLRTQAEAGSAPAQAELASRYHNGKEVLQNFALAADWYTRAAQSGLAQAQNQLGQYYYTGLGVEQSQTLAIQWLTAAAEQGAPQHMYALAIALENGADGRADPAAAAAWYSRAAQKGHTDAAVSLGVLYQNGTGVPQDFARALALYEGPAAQGHARAQNNLGLLYVRGTGVPQDYDRAAQLFASAASQGLAKAMTNLGVMYENGFGVPQDDQKAAELYRQGGQSGRKSTPAARLIYDPRLLPIETTPEVLEQVKRAARAGDPVAQFQLGWVLAQQDPQSFQSDQMAAVLFQSAASLGYAPAMANLGLLYFAGRGVPQDYVLGQMWLVLAGSAGLADAPALAAETVSRMTSGQINEAQTRAASYWGNAAEANKRLR